MTSRATAIKRNQTRNLNILFGAARQEEFASESCTQKILHADRTIGHFNLELGCWGLLKTCARFGSVSDWSILGRWSVYERNRLTTSEELRAPSGGRLFLYCEARTLDEQARAEGTMATRAEPSRARRRQTTRLVMNERTRHASSQVKQGGAEAGLAECCHWSRAQLLPPVYSLTCWPVLNVAATFGQRSALCFIVIIELN